MTLNSFQTSGNSPGSRDDRCQIGLLGVGAVGAALARRLTAHDAVPPLVLTHVCDRRARERRLRAPDSVASLTWFDRFDDLLASDTDIIVEAVSAAEPAADYIRAALLAGKSVVTASRHVMAHHGQALLTLAERQGRQLRYSATVGGALPALRVLGEGLGGDRIERVDAVVNSTTTSVLSRMEESGCSLDEAIAEACAAGYAESDPAIDLDGRDAATKLALICGVAFGVHVAPDAIERRSALGLTPDDLSRARQLGTAIRQVAHASFDRDRGRLVAWVAPIQVPASSPLAQTRGPVNAFVVQCHYGGTLTLSGSGAGAEVTAAALISDMRVIARDRAALVPAPRLTPPRELVGVSERTFAEAV